MSSAFIFPYHKKKSKKEKKAVKPFTGAFLIKYKGIKKCLLDFDRFVVQNRCI